MQPRYVSFRLLHIFRNLERKPLGGKGFTLKCTTICRHALSFRLAERKEMEERRGNRVEYATAGML